MSFGDVLAQSQQRVQQAQSNQPANMGAYAPSNNFDQLASASGSTTSYDPNNTTSPYQPSSGGSNNGGASGGAQNTPISAGTGSLLGSIAYGSYQGHAGWDINKLNDPNKHDPKYDWERSVQNVGGNQDLQKVVDYYNKNYGGNAKFMGGDHVDFGGNTGPVDVLFGHNAGINEDLWAPDGPGNGNTANNANAGNQGMMPGNIQQLLQQLLSHLGGTGINPNFNYSQVGPQPLKPPNPYQPQVDANGYYGGYQDPNGLRHPGNQPGMSYMI